MYVDFYFLPFRQLNTVPMTLPTDVMQQYHYYVGHYMKVNIKVLPIPLYANYTFTFNLLRVIFYTQIYKGFA